MPARFTFGGDEHLFVECSDEMSLEAFFKSLSMAKGMRESGIKGVTEICPANASFQIKFDPDLIKPDDLLREVRAIEGAAEKAEPIITTRIVEIPVFYNDPWTHETLMRFRETHALALPARKEELRVLVAMRGRHGILDLDVLDRDAAAGRHLFDDGAIAEQDGEGDLLVQQDARGLDDLRIFAFGEDDAPGALHGARHDPAHDAPRAPEARLE